MNALPQNIDDLIDLFSRLPGIGPKSAARIVFFLQKAPVDLTKELSESLEDARLKTKICEKCFNLSDGVVCQICQDDGRDSSALLVVEDALDLIAIERSGSFKGYYHVLGGVISPMNGIGPDEIRIKELVDRIKRKGGEMEVIIGTNPDMEGEATAIYIQKEVQEAGLADKVNITRLARGLATGADIDYVDDTTIRKAIEGRHNI